MRIPAFILLAGWVTGVSSQVYEEPPWIPPLPPPVEEYCGEIEKVSNPVLSYRVSEICEITDIKTVGEYQYGAARIRAEIQGFSSREMIKKFVTDDFLLFNEVSIDLHRSTEPASTLVCTVDMMGKRVIDARIMKQRGTNINMPYQMEPLTVVDGKLPNLGVFTYTNEVRYTINNCPEHMR